MMIFIMIIIIIIHYNAHCACVRAWGGICFPPLPFSLSAGFVRANRC